MSVCLSVAGSVVVVALSTFQLTWTHSVEHTEWREDWISIDVGSGQGLRLVEARVRGSGAGMDPGEGAVLDDGWWVWQPDLPAVPSLVLAASGTTGAGWTLCGETDCREFGTSEGEPVVVKRCE